MKFISDNEASGKYYRFVIRKIIAGTKLEFDSLELYQGLKKDIPVLQSKTDPKPASSTTLAPSK